MIGVPGSTDGLDPIIEELEEELEEGMEVLSHPQ